MVRRRKCARAGSGCATWAEPGRVHRLGTTETHLVVLALVAVMIACGPGPTRARPATPRNTPASEPTASSFDSQKDEPSVTVPTQPAPSPPAAVVEASFSCPTSSAMGSASRPGWRLSYTSGTGVLQGQLQVWRPDGSLLALMELPPTKAGRSSSGVVDDAVRPISFDGYRVVLEVTSPVERFFEHTYLCGTPL